MENINLQCISLSQIHSSIYVLQVKHSMTGKVYMGEVLIQIWLKNELLDKQMNVQN